MSIQVTVPNLPESVQDATLSEWHKQPGDTVSMGETLVELETDKVVLDVPAPQDGVVTQHLRHKGDVVTSGEMLAIIESVLSPPTPVAEAKPMEPESAPVPVPETVREETLHIYAQPISPAVRRLLSEHNLDAAQIKGSGKDGRLNKQDIVDYLETQKARPVAAPFIAPIASAAAPATIAAYAAPTPSVAQSQGERRVPMTRLRARIAERLLESQRNTATLTTFNEVDMHKVFEVRNQYKARFEQEYKVKLGFMSFFVKAAVEALKRFPAVNASIEGGDIVYHDYYDIGIAVSSDRGLVVPILRGVDKQDFGAIEKSVLDYSIKARDGKLSLEDLTGGTFTITNGGTYGSLLSTPILNPPQSGILGMHAIKDRPIVENGLIVIRPMIYLAFSYDHRLIDGREAVLFLYTIKELLEDPVRLLLKV
ncbi:MAG: 2-oxoglutarate dehydrogenase complex dihydrolipoyllysine-residue succinyltransferase [Proteobacteria bacterium]|nr:2-oxoglutarate dehydrogenase complex dihydrolipoyllysine-residue succinyltransferase [Pseudomonadota bacterium]